MASLPPRSTHLQTDNLPMPPSKRQRLSPDPFHPEVMFGEGYYQQASNYPTPNSAYNQNPVQMFNQPQPYRQLSPMDTGSRPNVGSMGPPEKPRADKATDINDLSDLVTAAGVDLRAEENYMAATYRNKHQDTSFSTSFGTNTSSTASPGNSFNQWSQGNYGNYPALQSNSSLSHPPLSQRSVEDELREKHRRAQRQKAEKQQAHLRNPFLQADVVRQKLHEACFNNQVKMVSATTLSDKAVRGASMVGADGVGIVAATSSMLEVDSSLVNILTLLSLACNERSRSLLEDAYAITRSRQYGSHGVVPPEWTSIATGQGSPKPTTARSQSITHTAWDQVPDSAVGPSTALPPKTPVDSKDRLPTPPIEVEAPLLPTVAYTSPITTALKSIAQADRNDEKKRLERRKKREKERQSSTLSESASPNAIASPATPSLDSIAPATKMTKKELAKQRASNQTEDYMHRQANKTASLALGGKPKYAWMTSGSAPAVQTLGAGIGLGRGSNAASRTNGGSANTQTLEDVGLRAKEHWKKIGDFREDGAKGKGVQIRDLLAVLEIDGMQKKTLARWLAKLSSRDDQR